MPPRRSRIGLGGLLALGGVILAAAGCAAGSGQPDTDFLEDRRLLVTIDNNHTLDVHMYALSRGHVSSLGVVSSLSAATFELPARVAQDGTVRLVADPIGSRSGYVSDRILVGPGQTVELTLENNLDLSHYRVY